MPTTAPTTVPRLKHPCKVGRKDRSVTRSTSAPSTFIATSPPPIPAPKRKRPAATAPPPRPHNTHEEVGIILTNGSAPELQVAIKKTNSLTKNQNIIYPSNLN